MPKPAPKADWEIAIEKFAAASAASAAKAAEEMAELRKHFNDDDIDEGDRLESDVAAAIIKDMSLGGVEFDEVITNAFIHGKHGNGEFDWVGINGKITMVGETKRTLKRGDVRRFVFDRLELFKHSRYSHLAKGKEVRGVLIYQKANKGAVEEALKLRMKVFRVGDDKTLHPVQTPPKRNQTKTHKRPRKSAA